MKRLNFIYFSLCMFYCIYSNSYDLNLIYDYGITNLFLSWLTKKMIYD